MRFILYLIAMISIACLVIYGEMYGMFATNASSQTNSFATASSFITPTPSPITGKTALISLSSPTGTFNVHDTFTESIIVDGGGQAFNAAQANVSTSSNLTITKFTTGDCNFAFLVNPSQSNLNFAGAILGNSSILCSVYMIDLQATAVGPASISITNGSVKAYSDNSEILNNVISGSFTIH